MITKVLIGFWLEVPTRVPHNLRQHQKVSNRAHLKMFVVSLACENNFEGRKLCGMKESINLRSLQVSQSVACYVCDA